MDAVVDLYTGGGELDRMVQPRNRVEWLRTCELLQRRMPAAPAIVADVGSGPGRQAQWLAGLGYETILFDLTPLHVDAARDRGLDAHIADARELPLADATVDVVLQLGPLYHLPDPQDRAQALTEAARVLKPGGILAAAALSRWARVLVKAAEGLLGDPVWHQHTLAMMRDGRADGDGAWDAVTYRHDPVELRTEVCAAGFTDVEVIGVEGPAGAWARRDPDLNDHAIQLAREAETTMAACSIHLLAFGTKPR
jgi:SAM-dependent methyltransferase